MIWAHPTALAPMEGLTDPLFRGLIAERGGVGLVCTEFVRITSNPVSSKILHRAVARVPGVPLSVQVMGNDEERMAEAAEIVAGAGADVVDINLGCPAPRVVRKGVGSAMLKDRRLLAQVVGAMRARVPGLLSAKIRAGFEVADGVLEIARTLEDVGVDFLVVHPRRRSDFFAGVADWRIVSLLVERLGIPVVGNGDCWYAADALRLMRETGCAAVMIGRPAVRNPWIFSQIEALRRGRPAPRVAGSEVVAHLRDLVARYRAGREGGDGALVGKVKEHCSYLGRALADGGKFRHDLLRLPTIEAILEHCERTLEELGPEELDLTAEGSFGLERSARAAPSIPNSRENCTPSTPRLE